MFGDLASCGCNAVLSFRVGFTDVVVVAELVVKNDALDDWLIQGVEGVTVDIEFIQLLQEKHWLAGLLVTCCNVGRPFQPVVDHCAEVFCILRTWSPLVTSEAMLSYSVGKRHHFLSLGNIQL